MERRGRGSESWPRWFLRFTLKLCLVPALLLLVLSNLVVVAPDRAQVEATRRLHACEELVSLERAVQTYRRETGFLPEQLSDLTSPYEGAPFYSGAELDPWFYPYAYAREGEEFLLVSFGADNLPGGIGDSEDIYLRPSGFVTVAPRCLAR